MCSSDLGLMPDPLLPPSLTRHRLIDLSDTQWREFRASIPALAACMLAFAGISRFIIQKQPHPTPTKTALYPLLCAFLFLSYLHGMDVVYVVTLISLNWVLSHACAGHRLGYVFFLWFFISFRLLVPLTQTQPNTNRPFIIWTLNLGTLVVVRMTEGFSSFYPHSHSHPHPHGGVLRWYICYNLTVLRMISFAMDLHWMRCSQKKQSTTSTTSAGSGLSDGESGVERQTRRTHPSSTTSAAKMRVMTPLSDAYHYSYVFSLGHALYPPLYIAGPIITYQDYVWQLLSLRSSSSSGGDTDTSSNDAMRTRKKQEYQSLLIVPHLRRLFLNVVCIELLTHCLYFNTIAIHKLGRRYAAHGLEFSPPTVGLTAWWVLTFMWLKFTVIWRTFRLFALLEGINPPENMLRCFASNVDIEGFWKGWHASFNRWLVRYLYLPMGGASHRALSIWPIFLFVAMWHDVEWRLISWAWLVCIGFVPEIVVKGVRGRSGWLARASERKVWWYSVGRGVLAAVNCAGLMGANMVGFVVGVGGMRDLGREVMASPRYIAAVLVSFYCAMQLNFYYLQTSIGRKEEQQQRKK